MSEMTNIRGAVEITANKELELNLRFGVIDANNNLEENYEDDFFFDNNELFDANIINETEEDYSFIIQMSGHDFPAIGKINKTDISRIE